MTLDDDNANLTLPPSRPSPGSWYVRLSSQHLTGPNLPWPPASRPARPSSEPSGAVLDGHGARRWVALMPLNGQSGGSPFRFMQTGLGPRFRLPSVDRRHPSSLGMGVPSSTPSCLPQRHYRELMKGDRGNAYHHQSLALGIGADALGELYWLPD